MEKSHSRPLSKRVPPVSKDQFNLNVVVRPRSAAKREQREDKLTREDISRAINIWASMYLASDESIEARDLCLPSRPWLGRNPSSVKRFE
ncbi:hypothetical protein [Noviherbaspirillum sp.]|uniref:hypothetical protein n=1 Tax=Noviherbaspirillum sp. TaxID=1926288 RepID=UPI002D24EC5A|nr:hypothetical protein [Noviherbaspirillum sp.]HZW23569.1 hypothetical protein [Noviherbaspirillum sp.]